MVGNRIDEGILSDATSSDNNDAGPDFACLFRMMTVLICWIHSVRITAI